MWYKCHTWVLKSTEKKSGVTFILRSRNNTNFEKKLCLALSFTRKASISFLKKQIFLNFVFYTILHLFCLFRSWKKFSVSAAYFKKVTTLKKKKSGEGRLPEQILLLNTREQLSITSFEVQDFKTGLVSKLVLP